LQFSTTDRSGIRCTKVDVAVSGEHDHYPPSEYSHGHQHEDGHEHDDYSQHEHLPAHSYPHYHDGGHKHIYVHGRSLPDILQIIERLSINESAKKIARRAFHLLGEAEAHIHDIPLEKVHFHEVGAADSILDIVCSAVGADSLGVQRWICSPLNVGGGTVQCAHGTYPVPAPATLELLRGVPIYSGAVMQELVTPTGAAIVLALNCEFADLPEMRIDRIGYGAGSRNTKDHPNALRLCLGEASSAPEMSRRTITAIETTIDDASPQLIGYVSERAFTLGALDFFTSPVQMKKNRPGTAVTLLCRNEDSDRMCQLLFRETTTLGMRVSRENCVSLGREIVQTVSPWGDVRIKVARIGNEIINVLPEYEDCRAIAERHGIPLKKVQEEVLREFQPAAAAAAVTPK
jgi:uncharacterized protein (TIGR00299 family) protein